MKVLVLEGGFNEEHNVSLMTAKEIKKILNKKKIFYKSLLVNPKKFKKDLLKFPKYYICFNALHGPFGESGEIQKILKLNKFRYTHSSNIASRKCFDKIMSKKIIKDIKIPTPKYLLLNIKNLNNKKLLEIKKKFNKFVIKPNRSGSSFGIEIIRTKEDMNNFCLNLKNYKKKLLNHNHLIIEKFIEGKELTVSVIKFKNKILPLEVTEIKSKNSFFDYKAKYTKGHSTHILPANISNKKRNECLNYALKAHKKLKCNVISRSDFIYNKKENKIFYLETNTQPGLTPISLLPEQAKYKNITFENIVIELLRNLK